MKTASKIGFLLFGLLIIYGCTNDKELNEKYGIAFNKVRKENHIPLLLENWGYHPSWPFHKSSLAWSPPIYKSGWVGKTIHINKKKKIYCEIDKYYSGRMIKSYDPDCDRIEEVIYVKFFFDGTEKNLIKIEVFLTAGEEHGMTTLKNAKKYLDKWKINVPELDYLIEKFESSPLPEGNKGSK